MTPDGSTPDAVLVDVLNTRLDNFERFAAEGVIGWMEGAGLSIVEVRLLLCMADGERARGAELAEKSGLSVDVAYAAMQKLETRGWVEQEHRQHFLTDDGHETVATLGATRRAAVERFVQSLGPEDRKRLADALVGG